MPNPLKPDENVYIKSVSQMKLKTTGIMASGSVGKNMLIFYLKRDASTC
ncbi:MAG: hypothetical protein U0J42_00035 [[Bacteroides] pectinophilus]|nr:hypothetical protein [[Bacteroides] pectinophilus]